MPGGSEEEKENLRSPATLAAFFYDLEDVAVSEHLVRLMETARSRLPSARQLVEDSWNSLLYSPLGA